MGELQSNNMHQISILRFEPQETPSCIQGFNNFCGFLLKTERIGVVETSKAYVKNFYLMVLTKRMAVPEELKIPLNSEFDLY